MKRFLLCTDLDRTLIPNGEQPESAGARRRFEHLVQRKEITLVYVTGRHLSLIQQAIADYHLPQPDFVIADVGSTIYQVTPSGWQQWAEWDAQIAPDWHGLSHDELHQLLGRFSSITLQEREKQNRHKLSFYVPLKTDAHKLVAEMDMQLKQQGIQANLIWSIDEAAQIGLLDVLPASANKLHAIRFLMQRHHFTREDTLFAGDSGNDLDVLLSDIPSVLVANAHEEVKKQVNAAPVDSLYIAQGNHLGMNGNYSAGILEGVAHYWPDAKAWLLEQN